MSRADLCRSGSIRGAGLAADGRKALLGAELSRQYGELIGGDDCTRKEVIFELLEDSAAAGQRGTELEERTSGLRSSFDGACPTSCEMVVSSTRLQELRAVMHATGKEGQDDSGNIE